MKIEDIMNASSENLFIIEIDLPNHPKLLEKMPRIQVLMESMEFVASTTVDIKDEIELKIGVCTCGCSDPQDYFNIALALSNLTLRVLNNHDIDNLESPNGDNVIITTKD